MAINHWDGSWRRFTWENQEKFPLGLTWNRDRFPAGLQYSTSIEINGVNLWAGIRKGDWKANQFKTLYYVEIQRLENVGDYACGQTFSLKLRMPYQRLFDAMKAAEKEIETWLFAKKGS